MKAAVIAKMFVAVPLIPFLVGWTLWGKDEWPLVVLAGLLLYYPIHQLGQTIGYHKLFGHRAFKPRRWYPFVATAVASIAFYGDPLSSAMIHRIHHRYSDTDRDPHSPMKGRFHAYLGWMATYRPATRDAMAVADLVRDYPWMTKFRRFEWLVPLVFHTMLYWASPLVSCAVLIGCYLSIQNALLLNTFSHDPHSNDEDKATDSVFLARWINPAFLHKYHHKHGALHDYSHAGVKDYWAVVIERLLAVSTK